LLEELTQGYHLVRVINLYIARLNFGELGFKKAYSKATVPTDPASRLYLYDCIQRTSRRLES
jgi:transposase